MTIIKHIYKSVGIVFIIFTLFSCEGNYKDVQKLNRKDGLPLAEGKKINMIYTDSGKVVSNLLAPKMLNYANYDFPYEEFPEGVEVRFYDKKGQSTVTSKYAIRYPKTEIVDLRDSVVLVTSDGNILNAQQLYWNQSKNWVFTDQPYRITFNDGSYNNGARFDANEDFTVFLSRSNNGVQLVEPSKNKN